MKKKGVLQSWHTNGFGMISVGEELFFLHRKNIQAGDPIIGSLVEFDVAPARGDGKFPQAVAALIVAPLGYLQRIPSPLDGEK
jgi:hypothetical protein